tara:strand:- start:1166 stop:1822 length:657 start_codon:yes stop_codon:yes gene_type:complete
MATSPNIPILPPIDIGNNKSCENHEKGEKQLGEKQLGEKKLGEKQLGEKQLGEKQLDYQSKTPYTKNNKLGEELNGVQSRMFQNTVRYFLKLIIENDENIDWIKSPYGYGRNHLIYCSDTLNVCIDCKEYFCVHVIGKCMKCKKNVCGLCEWVGQLAVKDRFLKSRLTEIKCCKTCKTDLVIKGKRNKFEKRFESSTYKGFKDLGHGISSGLNWLFGY